jgi:glucokinase
MKTALALGIDIGGTNSAFGLCDEKGEIFLEGSISTKSCPNPEDLIEGIHTKVAESGLIDQIAGIGIGAPNGNIYSGTIEQAPNLPWKGTVPMVELFQKRFDKPAILTNDANAAAIGEMKFGSAQGLKHFVVITLGTGLGSGVVVDGKLVYGHDGFAGEYGHFRVIPGGRKCGCGRNGCLETYVSATGVVRSVNELPSDNKKTSPLSHLETVRAEDVFQYAENGDPFAKEIIDFTAQTLGSALADYTCFSSPSAYILFGGIAQSGAPFANQVKSYMEQHMLNIYQNKIEIRISTLHDKNAAVLGSSSLVWDELHRSL